MLEGECFPWASVSPGHNGVSCVLFLCHLLVCMVLVYHLLVCVMLLCRVRLGDGLLLRGCGLLLRDCVLLLRLCRSCVSGPVFLSTGTRLIACSCCNQSSQSGLRHCG